jgi:hypothetical protein
MKWKPEFGIIMWCAVRDKYFRVVIWCEMKAKTVEELCDVKWKPKV